MNKQKIIHALTYTLFAVLCTLGAMLTGLIILFDWDNKIPIVIKLVFVLAYFALLMSPWWSRKYCNKKAIMSVLAAVIYIAICLMTSYGCDKYWSSFSPSKWERNEDLRYCMIDSLESKHQIIGMTNDEITALLGSPVVTKPSGENETKEFYEYHIGYAMIDVIVYRITIEDGKATETTIYHT